MTWIAECRNSIRTTLDLQNHLDSTFLLQEKKFMFLWIHATLPGVITRLPRRRLVEGKAKLRTNFQIYTTSIYHISIIYICRYTYCDLHSLFHSHVSEYQGTREAHVFTVAVKAPEGLRWYHPSCVISQRKTS